MRFETAGKLNLGWLAFKNGRQKGRPLWGLKKSKAPPPADCNTTLRFHKYFVSIAHLLTRI
jgi:hypothetical protein